MRKNLIAAAFAAAATMMILGINGFCAETDEFQAPEAELVSVEVVEAPVSIDCLPTQEEVAAPVEEVAAEEVGADVDYICADAEIAAPVEEIEAVIEEVPATPAVETPAEEVTETPATEAPEETPVLPSVGSAVVIKGEKTNGSIEVSDEDTFVEEPEVPQPEEPTPVVPQPEEPKPVEPQPEQPAPEVPSTPVVEEPQVETPSTPVEEPVEEEIVTAPEEVTILPAEEEVPEIETVSAPSTGRYLMTGDDDTTMNMNGIIALASLVLLCGYAVAKSAQKKYARA